MPKARPIRVYPDPVLRKVAEPVTTFDATLHTLLEDMAETMYVEDGVGLAAPQIGVSLRAIVVDLGEKRGGELIEIVNPELSELAGKGSLEEGCLSIPGFRETISRPQSLTLSYLDRHGKPHQITATDMLAVCIQHEIDHLNGVLFIDHLSRLKRSFFRSWAEKHLSGVEG